MSPAPISPAESPAARLQRLHEQELKVHAAFAKLDHALAAGEISTAQYAYYVERVYAGRQEHDLLRELGEEERRIRAGVAAAKGRHRTRLPAVAALLAFFLFAGMASILFFSHATAPLAGLITLEPTQPVTVQTSLAFSQSGAAALDVTNTTSLKLTGTLENGTADVYLVAGASRLLVYHGDASPPTYAVSTDKESYALDESVAVTVMPADSSYTLWLTDETGTKTTVQDGFVPGAAGAYTLNALINDSDNITKASTSFIVRNDTNVSNDVPRAAVANTLAFSGACVDTCDIPATGDAALSLDVVLSSGAVLTISSVTAAQPRANHAPVQTATVPDVTVAVGERATLDLSEYFADPDNDSLTYDFMNAPGVAMSVASGVLTVTGVAPGSQQSVIYASDLYSITQSNPFTITVTPATNTTTQNVTTENTTNTITTDTTTTNETNLTTTGNETNTTTNGTAPPVPVGAQNQTNETSNATTNATFNTTLDCTNPDPNQRPVACLNLNADEFFPDEEILLQNLDRAVVGRFTAIGNLLLKGGVYEHATGSPGPRDYRIGYVDRDGNGVAAVWIDSATGDLYLRGTLHEENANLVPPAGSYSLMNRRSVFLAYADQYGGDLYVRGNVIPYRKDIMK